MEQHTLVEVDQLGSLIFIRETTSGPNGPKIMMTLRELSHHYTDGYCTHMSNTSFLVLVPFRDLDPTACSLCALVKAAISTAIQREPDPASYVGLARRKVNVLPLKLIYSLRLREPTRETWDISPSESQVTNVCQLPQPLRGSMPFNDIACDPLSEESIHHIRFWVKDCRENHIGCPNTTSAPLPKRVIDTVSLRLYESRREEEDYIALSHCWGKVSDYKTTTRTLSARCAGLEWQDLPRGFQDAISLTRALSIRYLWIDSICILQDDKADWEAESADMANIYRNAYLTVAASSTSGDHEGFLFPRTTRNTVIGKFELPNGFRATFKIRESIKHTGPPYRDRARAQPLDGRAWGLQERLVPHRLISFAQHETEWNCRTFRRCDCKLIHAPRGSGSTYGPKKLWYNFRTTPSKLHEIFQDLLHLFDDVKPDQKALKESGRKEIYKTWRELLLPIYSLLDLTMPSDRLPALSALAELLAPVLADDYLAGLWRGDLARGITWQPSRCGSAISPAWPPEQYRAPSWSWASVDGAIEPFDMLKNSIAQEYMVEVLDAQCTSSGPNKFGAVDSGRIIIQANAVWGELSVPKLPATTESVRCIDCKVYFDERKKSCPVQTDTPLISKSGVNGETAVRARLRPSDARDAISVPALCVDLVRYAIEGKGSQTDPSDSEPGTTPELRSTAVLVLVKSLTVKGAYERIGVVNMAQRTAIERITSEMNIIIV